MLVRFPAEESGNRYDIGMGLITAISTPDISVSKVYQSQASGIQVHQSRVKTCPTNFPASFFWYGSKSRGRGRPPKWVEKLLAGKSSEVAGDSSVKNNRALQEQITRTELSAEVSVPSNTEEQMHMQRTNSGV